ncbi:MAG TPA: dihydrolipoyl dehydrogenase [Dehalococcoidia bacterium]|nr:dihydrolipoyl dehydrogenase [Dehalococcoidia bacterium]
MEKYDLIVIGSGSGQIVVDEAISQGWKVALIDQGPLGGTCLNVGCIPSKMLIFPADRIVEMQEAGKLGIAVDITNIDFKSIMQSMRTSISQSRDDIMEAVSSTENLHFYAGTARFTGDYMLEVNEEQISAPKIVIATGTRPFIPPIKGIEGVSYLTNETALQLEKKPHSLIIIGGGYIAVEFGHFFAAMGTEVTMVEMADRLVTAEEPEISELLKRSLGRRMGVYTNYAVVAIEKRSDNIVIIADNKAGGGQKEFTGGSVMMAVGRKSNADTLNLQNTGVEIGGRGFIKVDEYLETSKKNIYAIGDSNGQQMFRHVANAEAWLVAGNMLYDTDIKMDYTAAPHAVYSHPQIASVGLSEEAARKHHGILVGKTRYYDIAKGEAMLESEGFAKAIIEKDTHKILGFHIIGPYAPELIQEVVNAISSGGHAEEINDSMHIHPALSELVQSAINNVV